MRSFSIYMPISASRISDRIEFLTHAGCFPWISGGLGVLPMRCILWSWVFRWLCRRMWIYGFWKLYVVAHRNIVGKFFRFPLTFHCDADIASEFYLGKLCREFMNKKQVHSLQPREMQFRNKFVWSFGFTLSYKNFYREILLKFQTALGYYDLKNGLTLFHVDILLMVPNADSYTHDVTLLVILQMETSIKFQHKLHHLALHLY